MINAHTLFVNPLDEVPPSEVKSVNLLADLVQRFYSEQAALIGQLRSPDSQDASKKQWLLPLVLLSVEWWRAEQEEWFDIGAMSIGLFERIGAATDKRCSEYDVLLVNGSHSQHGGPVYICTHYTHGGRVVSVIVCVCHVSHVCYSYSRKFGVLLSIY